MTPSIAVSGNWSFRGFLYLNASRFQFNNVTGAAASFAPPGEPWLDLDQDGSLDAGESWVNLDYGTMVVPGDAVRATSDGSARADRGPPIAGLAAFQGILYTSGLFEATGAGTLYGSLIAASGVVQAVEDGSAPTPALFWDASIGQEWPPPGWALPRVTVTGWVTDR